MLRYDVFGRHIGVIREDDGWRAVFIGDGGKHREAPGIVIPDRVEKKDLARFLADVFHESARPDRPDVRLLGTKE